jgi:hypothetical protein
MKGKWSRRRSEEKAKSQYWEKEREVSRRKEKGE